MQSDENFGRDPRNEALCIEARVGSLRERRLRLVIFGILGCCWDVNRNVQ